MSTHRWTQQEVAGIELRNIESARKALSNQIKLSSTTIQKLREVGVVRRLARQMVQGEVDQLHHGLPRGCRSVTTRKSEGEVGKRVRFAAGQKLG